MLTLLTLRPSAARLAVRGGPRIFLLIISMTMAALPASSQDASDARMPGTQRMVERLKKLAAMPGDSPFANVERVARLRSQLEQERNPRNQPAIRYELAQQLLFAGESEASLAELAKLDGPERGSFPAFPPKQRAEARLIIAQAFLRIGEQQNCLAHHSAESCLLPLQGAGIHTKPEGSRGAIEVLQRHLKIYPDDLDARWLYNLAFMTLGEYPAKVPPSLLIDPKAFASGYQIKPFTEIAGALGVNEAGLGGGAIAEDFDGDGFIDLMCAHYDLKSQVRLFHNNGDGTFSDRTKQAGLTGITGGINMLTTDYNNDGFPDILMLRGGWLRADGHLPKSLLRNKGDGAFEDVAEEAGVLSLHPTQTGAWLDYDSDGWLDLFIGNESTPGEMNPCELYHNNGDGTFTDCAKKCGLAVERFVKGVAAGDYNNDRRPDLYLSCLDGMNILLRNDGPAGESGGWKFTNVASEAGVTEPKLSFPAWFWDYDNDGWLDIFVSGYSKEETAAVVADYLGESHYGECARLYHNKHDGTFEDVTARAKLLKPLLSMGVNFGDIDNDGFLDFYVGTGTPGYLGTTPNRMFRNDGGVLFQDVTSAGRVGHLQKGHGIAFADLDHDGDQDIYQSMGGAYTGDIAFNTLYENPGGPNHWLTLKLEGKQTNRAALGARIEVIVQTEKGLRSIHKTVSTGGSFGCSPLRQEIGLGTARSIKQVRIIWPVSGTTQVLEGLKPNSFYRIREGEAAAVPWALKKIPLGNNKASKSG